jgi:hypothetical protein
MNNDAIAKYDYVAGCDIESANVKLGSKEYLTEINCIFSRLRFLIDILEVHSLTNKDVALSAIAFVDNIEEIAECVHPTKISAKNEGNKPIAKKSKAKVPTEQTDTSDDESDKAIIKKIRSRMNTPYNQFFVAHIDDWHKKYPHMSCKNAAAAIHKMWEKSPENPINIVSDNDESIKSAVKKSKSGNIPRQPSAFNQFMKSRLIEYKKQYPNLHHTTAFTAVAGMWATAPENPKNKNN